MKIQLTTKRSYISPKIEKIVLDNEISLALESLGDPGEPGVTLYKAPEHFNTNPYNYS